MDAQSTRQMIVGEQDRMWKDLEDPTLTKSSNLISPVMGRIGASNLVMWPTE